MKIDIEKLALLARIKLTPKEKEKFQSEFAGILDYVSQLKKVDTRSMDDKEAGRTNELENVMRDDVSPNEPGGFSDILLKEAPSTKNGYIKVKHILEK